MRGKGRRLFCFSTLNINFPGRQILVINFQIFFNVHKL
ncbi:hypothetical protein SLEP1_g42859 [Rubroshorea leprosula]|uniref:Uncharacterized protein n=1 Tax=Rubroshorea leprosula TaxID=152421 RepID=A0AAV5LBK2_9ROSI|nr:hypothetical protein SLEP1_g42859 [Rubroshorea leprosula]